MNLEQIRKLIIVAICSDADLLNRLVLKGGNALSLIHNIGLRTSVDIDFSMADDFKDIEEAKERLFTVLKEKFREYEYTLFDEKFERKPNKTPFDPEWGGYRAEFKLISSEKYQKLEGSLQSIRRQSIDIDLAGSSRKFKIDISKFEYTVGKEEVKLDQNTCYVYSLPMIAAEKLRAICQQIDGYEYVKNPRPRARDFYDIYSIAEARALDFSSKAFLELVSNMFEAKKVPLKFLGKIPDQYSFHSQDWPAVRDTIQDSNQDFRFYFDYVLKRVAILEPLWIK